ncbi:hypothetical protein CFK40_14145 [Virgibacillus necropolis]|uniref:Uncharacterized protein n=1 Tax=Virgibacillus necropolis TaxID=163877 RepID=A0A221MEH3_9BACI|nr:hypothetical protein CFK40_14145 [Virgibacillus necropolis]
MIVSTCFCIFLYEFYHLANSSICSFVHFRNVVDTTIDTEFSGAVQAGFTAGTALIPNSVLGLRLDLDWE